MASTNRKQKTWADWVVAVAEEDWEAALVAGKGMGLEMEAGLASAKALAGECTLELALDQASLFPF